MKRLVFTFALTLAAFLSVTAAHAQQLQVKIPFGFTAGNAGYPAGTYYLASSSGPGLTGVPSIIRIVSTDNHVTGSVITMLGHWDNQDHQNLLIFDRIGDHYMLRHIVTATGMNAEIPKWKTDHKLHEAKNEKPEEVVLTASAYVASR